MVNFGVPYAMDGTTIPGVDLRWDSQRKVGVGSGVTDVGDLKVMPLSTPGAGVRVAAGGVLVQCRAAGRGRETYSLSNHTTQNYMGDGGAGIPGTGSGAGRSDMVILEILDSSFAKTFTPKAEWPADQWAKISIVSGVPATATSVEHVPALANVTAYALARIDYPASTATITAAMVKDLRKLQSPKRSEVVYARPRVSTDDGAQANLTATVANGGEYFPGGVGFANEFQVDVPEGATRMVVDASWLSVSQTGTPHGRMWMEYGDEYRNHTWPNKQQFEFTTQHFAFNPANTTDEKVSEWRIMDEVPVPAKLRGKRVTFVFKAGHNSAFSAPHKTWMGSLGGLGCRVTFAQVAVDADLI